MKAFQHLLCALSYIITMAPSLFYGWKTQLRVGSMGALQKEIENSSLGRLWLECIPKGSCLAVFMRQACAETFTGSIPYKLQQPPEK